MRSLKSLKSTKSTLFSRKMDTKHALKMWALPTLCFGIHLTVYSSTKPGFSHTIPQGTLNGLSAGNGTSGPTLHFVLRPGFSPPCKLQHVRDSQHSGTSPLVSKANWRTEPGTEADSE